MFVICYILLLIKMIEYKCSIISVHTVNAVKCFPCHTNCVFWGDVTITMNLQLYSSMIFIDNKVDG